jgi:hypothetical protein
VKKGAGVTPGSPDGEKIAFNRVFSPEDEEVDDGQIFVMNADDGSDVTRLTDNDDDDREPDWGTNTSTHGDDNGDDDDKNKHDSKKKHHDDNAKKKH